MMIMMELKSWHFKSFDHVNTYYSWTAFIKAEEGE